MALSLVMCLAKARERALLVGVAKVWIMKLVNIEAEHLNTKDGFSFYDEPGKAYGIGDGKGFHWYGRPFPDLYGFGSGSGDRALYFLHYFAPAFTRHYKNLSGIFSCRSDGCKSGGGMLNQIVYGYDYNDKPQDGNSLHIIRG
jgi:hypothetical protein